MRPCFISYRMGKRISFQQKLKHTIKSCVVCNESKYDLLDVHRIVPGSQGGKYTTENTVCLCCKCHRRVHAGEIVIDRYYPSTTGRLLHYFDNGVEFWK